MTSYNKLPDNFVSKPERSLEQSVEKPDASSVLKIYKGGFLNVVWGSESNANFLDVLSVGPVSSIEKMYINEVDLEAGEFPKSRFFPHTGEGSETPWAGGFPFVERT